MSEEAEPISLTHALLESVSDETDPQRLARLADAITAEASALIGQVRYAKAILMLDVVIDRFEDDPQPGLEGAALAAFANKVVALAELGRAEESRTLFEEMVARFGKQQVEVVFDETSTRLQKADERHPREKLAAGLYAQAEVFGELDRTGEALSTITELITRFEDDPNANIHSTVAEAHALRERIMKDLFGRINDSFPDGR